MRKVLVATATLVCSLWSGAALRPNFAQPVHSEVKEAGATEAATSAAAAATPTSTPPKSPQGEEVVVGARAWRYDRVYPLLDGLFQDVVSSSVTQLTLNNNSANAANLNALVQSLQIQAGYNQLSGVQNSVASQMAVANLGYQSLLAQQSQSILQQQLTAQQQLAQQQQAQTDAQNKKDQAAYDAATAQIQTLNSTIASLAAQMALVKNPTTPWAPSAASGNIANATSAFSTAIPSGVLSSGTLTGGPSFPPTKQLDNQVDLLWSRLARVVGTMSQPDSGGPDDKLFLIEFSTATFPNQNHEKYLLDTTYDLTCDDQKEAEYMPTVVDVFPRVAALNIVDTRYKDQGFSLAAVVSFLGFGVNGAYNREHLKMTQLLGQSSYITGYGVGQSHFGWKFGIPLGDKVISSDIKKTFALIRVPAKCTKPTVSFDKVWWGKQKQTPQADDGESNAVKTELTPELKAIKTTMETIPPTSVDPFVEQINFNRTVYDPTKYSSSNPVPVSLVMHFSDNLDSQILVYANGVLIKRARDTFGRAVSSTSTPGLLESSSLAPVNTWLPTSSKSLLLNLDGGQFGETFPTIMIVPPSQQTITVGPNVTSDTEITVSGKAFHCIQARCNLPSIAYRQTTPSRITATRWSPAMNDDYKVVFRTNSTPQPLSVSSNAPSSVQLVTGSEQQDWGTNAEVYAIVDDDSPGGSSNQVKLQCDPTASSGQRLVCDMGSILPQVSFGDVQNNVTGSLAIASTDPPTAKYALASGQLPPGVKLASDGTISGMTITRGAVGFSLKISGTNGEKEIQRKYLGVVGPTGWLLEPKKKITFHIIDEGHSGGPLEGWTELPDCSTDCLKPTIWSIGNPQWSDQKNGWDLTIQVVNVDVTQPHDVHLQLKTSLTKTLEDKGHTGVYSAVFSIQAKDINLWYDTVAMTVDGLDSDLKLLNIHSLIAPVVTYISPDSTSWSGQNLTNLFRYVEVGSSTKGVPITCPVITACAVNGGASAIPQQTGVLYVASSADPKSPDFVEQPLMKLNANGTLSPISYQPPTKDQTAKAVVVGTSQTPSTATPGQPGSGTAGQTSPATALQPLAAQQQRMAQISIQ